MDFTSWLSLVAVCVLGAISPGPSLAVILRVSISQSALHGVCAGLAHGLGIGFWAFLTLQGLAVVIEQYQQAFSVLTILGGLYLAWLGVKSLRYAGKGQDEKVEAVKSSYWESIRDGLMVALMNPKIALFFLALFSQLVDSEMTAIMKIQFWTTVVAIDSGWYILVALLLAGGPVLLWLRRNIVWVDRVMGCLLILIGLKVVIG
ncbi:LysE family translocator [Marinomonas colpomeniae]|uniref:LysE family translocator n=1 Tax=Marinomonas colpomeniae TaxID=2774408 RepID=A0ABR8NVQ4_9GAMM|nr:LysE family translocator [Marinomonas colpomeniae]MBD5770135.1 LysE family translocator [Marinomonas colpomeniae]